MGYDIYIGQRRPHQCEDSECCSHGYTWPDEVDEITLPDAPAEPETERSDRTNGRHPSYANWDEFARRTGLVELMAELIPDHPGIVTLTEDHYAALARAKTTYGYDAKRLTWLRWWTRWALDHCEWPSFYNR